MEILAQISGNAVISAVLWIVIIGVIFWLLNYLIDYVALQPPFAKVAKIILMIAAIVLLINALLTLVGKPFINWR